MNISTQQNQVVSIRQKDTRTPLPATDAAGVRDRMGTTALAGNNGMVVLTGRNITPVENLFRILTEDMFFITTEAGERLKWE